MEFARQEFKLGSGSNSIREQLNLVWKNTGRKPKELEDLISLPDSTTHVWGWFIDLNNARSSNGFGVNPLSYSEIWSYFNLMQLSPDEWEVKLIKALDNIAIEQISKDMKEKSKKK